MSIRVMTWVWEHARVKGSELLLLLAIADHADDQGRNAWPSIARLAERTRVDRRTVQRLLRRLAQQGCLAVEHTEGPRGTNRYTVLMPTSTRTRHVDNTPQAGDNNVEIVDNRGGGKMPPSGNSLPKGRHRSDEGAAPLSPEPPSTNHPMNPAIGHLDLAGVDDPPTVHPFPSTESDARIVLAELGPEWPLGPLEVDQLVPKVRELLDAGWPRPRLIAVLSARARGVRSPVAVLHVRLRELASQPHSPRRRPERSTYKPPWCGDPTCDTRTRMRDDNSGRLRRCPVCHPLRVGPQ